MIEVPFEEGFIDFAIELINEGMRYFHIDVGDGKFISRKFSGIEKIKFLNSLNKELIIHVHLMVKNPHHKNNSRLSTIEEYINAGAKSIALHKRAFKYDNDFINSINLIRDNNCIPGIIIDVENNELEEIWRFIKINKIHWIVIMGVPIGYGGQLFQSSSLSKISFFRKRSDLEKYNLEIEVDGGLNIENVKDCYRMGGNILAGWSIIKDKKAKDIVKKYKNILNLLKS